MTSVIMKVISNRITTILSVSLKKRYFINHQISKEKFGIQGLSTFGSHINVKFVYSPLLSHFQKFYVMKRQHNSGNEEDKAGEELITVTFITKDGKCHTVKGKEGENALFLAQRHEIEMEGACEASLACTTCHVYVNENFFDQLPPAEEKEEDLLDMAPFLKPNSRLGCQIILTKEINGIELTLPKATRNFYVDGHKPQPH